MEQEELMSSREMRYSGMQRWTIAKVNGTKVEYKISALHGGREAFVEWPKGIMKPHYP